MGEVACLGKYWLTGFFTAPGRDLERGPARRPARPARHLALRRSDPTRRRTICRPCRVVFDRESWHDTFRISGVMGRLPLIVLASAVEVGGFRVSGPRPREDGSRDRRDDAWLASDGGGADRP